MKATFVVLCIALVATAAACGTPEEYTIYGSSASGELAGDELPAETSENVFRGQVRMINPDLTPENTGFQIELAKRVRGLSSYLLLATYELKGDRKVMGGIRTDRNMWAPVVYTSFESDKLVKTYVASPLSFGGDSRRVLVGWVVDPRVATFTLKFSNGVEQTLETETHEYFISILGLTHPNNTDLDVVEVVARDAGGNVIR
jgi:hypothetical protein